LAHIGKKFTQIPRTFYLFQRIANSSNHKYL
jgi:hypothetical protein